MHYGQHPGAPAMPHGTAQPAAPRSRMRHFAAGVALLLGVLAAIGGIGNLQRSATNVLASNRMTPPPAPDHTTTQPATRTIDSTATEDLAVCTAIAPLMSELDKFSNAYVDLGDAGTPGRDAALPRFISDTQNWVAKIQPIVDQHPTMDPRLRRTLQRLIDDRALMTSDMVPGRMHDYQEDMWADSLGAYSGPLHRCDEVGVRW